MKHPQFYKNLLLIFTLLNISTVAFTQRSFKFGKYDKEEFDLMACEFEKDADEIILFHTGTSNFINGHLYTDYHLRKKILKEDSKEMANIAIRYYPGNDGIENIKNIKAQLVNFNNGKEEVFKLGKNEIFEVDLPNGYKEIRMVFPQVKEGSIIEYSYEKLDKYITFIDGWTFQNSSPTLYSRYTIGIPESLKYNMLRQGIRATNTDIKTTNNGFYYWELENLHSIKPEAFISNYIDYVERLEFQLASYIGRTENWYGGNQSDVVDVLNTWEKAGDDILEASNYYSYLKTKKGQNIISDIDFDNANQLVLTKSIYKYIQENFTSTSNNGIIPSQTQKELINSRAGTKADLNLLLMSLLHSKGIEADPVLISSKGNGRSQLVKYPFVTQFNQLITRVVIDGETFYFDASNPRLFPGFLNLDNHVNEGFLLKNKNSQVISLELKQKSGITQMSNISFFDDKIVFGQKARFIDYESFGLKEKTDFDEESIKNHLFKDNDGSISEFSIKENYENSRIDLIYEFSKPIASNPDVFYLVPFHLKKFNSNPFIEEYRNFPVDFKHVFSDKYSVNITIPEGYKLEQLPENLNISMTDKDIHFTYNTNQVGQNVFINVIFDINNNIIAASKYNELKAILDIIINKFNEPLVLKKS